MSFFLFEPQISTHIEQSVNTVRVLLGYWQLQSVLPFYFNYLRSPEPPFKHKESPVTDEQAAGLHSGQWEAVGSSAVALGLMLASGGGATAVTPPPTN